MISYLIIRTSSSIGEVEVERMVTWVAVLLVGAASLAASHAAPTTIEWDQVTGKPVEKVSAADSLDCGFSCEHYGSLDETCTCRCKSNWVGKTCQSTCRGGVRGCRRVAERVAERVAGSRAACRGLSVLCALWRRVPDTPAQGVSLRSRSSVALTTPTHTPFRALIWPATTLIPTLSLTSSTPARALRNSNVCPPRPI